MLTLTRNIARWQSELDRLNVTWRWGDTRRFHTNARKIARTAWLIRHIADAKARLQGVPVWVETVGGEAK